MLSHYSALKVAENFRVLETLYPGRIDLGIGRAPGSDRRPRWRWRTAPARWASSSSRPRSRDVMRLAARRGRAGATLRRGPRHAGRADRAGGLAARISARERRLRGPLRHGVLVRPLHQRQRRRPRSRAYQRSSAPRPMLAEPQASIGVFVVCADTEAEARPAQSRVAMLGDPRRLAASGCPTPRWPRPRRTSGRRASCHRRAQPQPHHRRRARAGPRPPAGARAEYEVDECWWSRSPRTSLAAALLRAAGQVFGIS